MINNLYDVITEGRYKIQPIFERFTLDFRKFPVVPWYTPQTFSEILYIIIAPFLKKISEPCILKMPSPYTLKTPSVSPP